MTETIPLDSGWIAANPPPVHGLGTTKNSRGRVLAIGGSAMVPGALRLTGEAALRVGAGKLQMATIASAAIGLGLLVPEAGVLALPQDDDGEIDHAAGPLLEKSLNGCDTLVVGPGMGSADATEALLRLILTQPCDEATLVVDAMPSDPREVARSARGIRRSHGVHAASRRNGDADGYRGRRDRTVPGKDRAGRRRAIRRRLGPQRQRYRYRCPRRSDTALWWWRHRTCDGRIGRCPGRRDRGLVVPRRVPDHRSRLGCLAARTKRTTPRNYKWADRLPCTRSSRRVPSPASAIAWRSLTQRALILLYGTNWPSETKPRGKREPRSISRTVSMLQSCDPMVRVTSMSSRCSDCAPDRGSLT